MLFRSVARDLALQGYRVEVFDEGARLGGMVRTQIPKFRLPDEVIDEECGYITSLGEVVVHQTRVNSLKEMLAKGFDAIFVGTGAPRGRALDLPGKTEGATNIHTGIEWLANVSFGHFDKIGKRVIVLGGGNTAMDCCRTARRLGGDSVTVVVRSGFEEMKASPWEKDDAIAEDIPILNYLAPKTFVIEGGKLAGMTFEKVRAVYDEKGRRDLVPTGEPDTFIPCDDVLVAVGQENAFPWIERDIGLEFDRWGLPKLDAVTFQSSIPNVFFGGDAAFGPKNIIWAVAHGHDAAISIDKFIKGENLAERPTPGVAIVSQKMGIHEWSYDNAPANDARHKVPHLPKAAALKDIKAEVELGYDIQLAMKEAQRLIETSLDAGEDAWHSGLLAIYGRLTGGDQTGRIARADAWLRRHPEDANLLLALGRMCFRQRLWGKAQSYLEASIAVRPSVAAHLELAEMLEQHGRHDQASPHFKTCLKLALHARHGSAAGGHIARQLRAGESVCAWRA